MSSGSNPNGDSEINAEEWKTRGSKYFYIKKFPEAIKCYSKALVCFDQNFNLDFNFQYFILANEAK